MSTSLSFGLFFITLGSGTVDMSWKFRILLALLSTLAISNIALRIGSPAWREGTTDFGRLVSSDNMSVATCAKKSFRVTDRKAILCGKNSTVSALIRARVLGI